MKIVSIPAWVTQTNAYLVYGEDSGVGLLVDAPPDPEHIGEIVRRHDVTIGAVLLTHGHIDHTGGAGEIEAKHGSEIFVHPDDDFLTLHPVEQLTRMFGMKPPGSYQVPERFTHLRDGQILEVAGLKLETKHTPGHTPGHCCFYVETEATLFAGDQLFAGSVGRTDLPGGSTEELLNSMAQKVLTLDDETRVLPGHGPETTIGRERRSNPFLQNL